MAAGPTYRVETAQLNAITSLAALFVTPSLRAQSVSDAPASPRVSGGFDRDRTKEVRHCKAELLNTQIHRNEAAVQCGVPIDVRTRLKLLFPMGLRG